jgi:hypothetical protein
MNARTLLIGIGIVAVVTGGVLGSGALTQVNAERSATVTTTGDASAAIGLSAAPGVDSTINSTSTTADGELQIAFNNINLNATTTTTAFQVTNNLNEPVGIQISSDASWLSVVNVANSSTGGYDNLDTGSANAVTVQLEIDTTDSSFTSGDSATISVEADTQESA